MNEPQPITSKTDDAHPLAEGSLRAESQKPVRSRPSLFRALGKHEPPAAVEIAGQIYQRAEIFKHDSWAATALYENPQGRVVCKFNRQQSIALFPMRWLGWLLARRETILLKRLAEMPNVPAYSGEVSIDGRRLNNVVAHEFVPGHPLRKSAELSDAFFTQLTDLLSEIHRLEIAYVDLHKRENILVGEDGLPYLIDFQIGFWLPSWQPARFCSGWLLKILQRSDRYHLLKHFAHFRPDQCRADIDQMRPWIIRMHRKIAVPIRSMRRRLLVALGIRSSSGRASSEANPEIGHRASIEG